MAQNPALLNKWSYHTAYLMRKHKFESGLVQPFRYGLTDKIEISANVLQMVGVPNLSIKTYMGCPKGFQLASEHGLQYNTPLFNLLSRKGTGGVLSPQFDFPGMITVYGTFLGTKQVFDTAYLTVRAGIYLSLRNGYLDPLATVDLPLIYPRTSHLFNHCTFRIGTDLRGKIRRSWSYMFDWQFFVIPIKEHNFFLENTGVVMCDLGRHARIRGGYKLCYGDYPFGKQWHLLPTIDLVFGSK